MTFSRCIWPICAAWILVFCSYGPTQAQPTVRVQAETRIELVFDRQDRSVIGTLRDDLGIGLGGREVTVVIRPTSDQGQRRDDLPSPRALRTRTTHSGQFSFPLGPESDHWRITARFAGTSNYSGVHAGRTVDVQVADVSLVVGLLSTRLDLDQPSHEVTVRASSRAGVEGLRIALQDELGRRLAAGRIEAGNQLRLQVPSEALGSPGPGRLSATSEADNEHSRSRTELSIVRFRQPHVELAVVNPPFTEGESIELRGRLYDSQGGLSERAMAIRLGNANARMTLTDQEGGFELSIPSEQVGVFPLVAEFESDSPGRPSVSSDVVEVEIRAASTSAPYLFWAALFIGLLVATGLNRRNTAAVRAALTESIRAPAFKPGPVQMRSASEVCVRGRAIEAISEQALQEATVTLHRAGTVIATTRTGSDGRFIFESPPRAQLQLSIEKPGYRTHQTQLELPHRGEWTDAEIRVESLRQIALAPLRRIARHLLARDRTWGIWTNREIGRDRLEAALGPQTAQSLVKEVDDAFYGQRPPSEGEIEKIEALAEKANELHHDAH